MMDYTIQIKDLCDSLSSINVVVNDDEMVHIYQVGGLTQKYGAFQMGITTRENPPSFFKLQFVLMVEENRTQSKRKARHQMGR